jgi:hypothetical protein
MSSTMRHLAIRIAAAASLALASSCYSPVTTERRTISAAAPRWVAPAGTTFTVELVDPIDSNVSEAPLIAVVVAPMLTGNGSTIVKSGAAVAGRAIGIRGPNGSSLRLELDSIETIRGKTTLFATFAPLQHDTSLAGLDFQGPGLGYDAQLGQPPAAPVPAPPPSRVPETGSPSAIGGGPREDVPSSGPSMQLRRGTRLDLLLTRPLSAAAGEPLGGAP